MKSLFRSFHSKTKLLSEVFPVFELDKDHENPLSEPFLISKSRGFLPRKDPIMKLPSKFEALESLLQRMRWNQPNGSKGLLAKRHLGEAIEKELPEIDVSDINDKMIKLAILRDYSFLTSAYLLEECHHNYLKTGNSYGIGREIIPKNLAKPFVRIATELKMRPFLEYNSGYSLNNWYRLNQDRGIEINNLGVHRTFINMRSESGFILVHVAINQHGGMLVSSGLSVLKAAEMKDRASFNESLKEMSEILVFMNQEFERMYYESNPSDYNIFRTFILGIINQPMFPRGVIYEGCFDNKPQFFRGESGANDSIIPFCDNILQITESLPINPLTKILRDFRSYRPEAHRKFLDWSEEVAKKVGVLEYAKQDPVSMVRFLQVADQIRAFRHRHWTLTNLYIINFSKHPVATGGSPIVTWLPNQLLTVIDFIKMNGKSIDQSSINSYDSYNLNSILRRAEVDERIIRRETDQKKKIFQEN